MRIFHLVVLLFIPYFLVAQTLEELKEKCKKENIARNWNALAEYYYENDADNIGFQEAVTNGYSLALKENNNEEVGVALMYLGEIIFETEGFDGNIAKNKEALSFLNKTSRKDLQAQAYDNIGYANNAMGKYNEAIKNHKKAIELLKDDKKYDTKLNRVFYNLSVAYTHKGEQDSAKNILLEIIPTAINLEDTALLAVSYNALGILHKRNNEFKKAIEYYEKTLQLYNEKNEIADRCNTISNIATLYTDWKKYKEALTFAREGAKIVLENPTSIDFPERVFNDLGSILVYNGKYKEGLDTLYLAKQYIKNNLYQAYINNLAISTAYFRLNNLDSCNVYLDNAEQILADNKNFPSYRFYKIKGNLLTKQGLFKEAIPYFEEYVKLFGNNYSLRGSDDYEVYNLFSLTHEKGTKDFEQALKYKSIAYNLRDSIYKQEHNEAINEFYVKYQTLEKELEISRLNEEQQQILYNRTLIVGGLIFLAVLLIIALLYNRIKRQKKEKEALELSKRVEQKELEYKSLLSETESRLVKRHLEGRELERKVLAKELHDSVANDVASIMVQSETNMDQEKTNLVLKNIYEQIRQISHQLMPPEFSYISLADMIEDYTDLLNETSPVCFKTNISDRDRILIDELPKEEAKELYYILQEAIGNILKHADAAHVDINIFYNQNGEFIFSVIDDGKGFDADARFKGIGLRTIKDRAQGINAKLNIESGIGKGTKIVITLASPELLHQEK